MFVVLEDGARWPVWVDRHRKDEDAVVIVQQSTESLRELLGRVQRAADQLAARNRCIQTAVFSLRTGAPPAARAERARSACALLRHVCTRAGAFVLCADDPSAEERHELLALCGALTEGLVGTGTAVVAVLDSRAPSVARSDDWERPRALGVRAARRNAPAAAAAAIERG